MIYPLSLSRRSSHRACQATHCEYYTHHYSTQPPRPPPSQIDAVSAGLIAGANIFVFSTIYSYFVFFGRDEEWDWMNDGL